MGAARAVEVEVTVVELGDTVVEMVGIGGGGVAAKTPPPPPIHKYA